MSVHPQVAVLLERVARSPMPPYHVLPPIVARRVYHDTRTVTSPVAPEMEAVSHPATDQRAGYASHERNAEGYLLTRKVMEYFRGHYLPAAADWLDWRASPLLASSLAGLPPAYVLTAGYDPLVDEGRAYAERLSSEGVQTNYREYPDMVHGFLLMGGVLDTATAAVSDCCAALRVAFEAH